MIRKERLRLSPLGEDKMTCKTCGEIYPKGQKKIFVHYCCKEQAWAELEKSLQSLKVGLEDYSAILDLDMFLTNNGIKQIEE